MEHSGTRASAGLGQRDDFAVGEQAELSKTITDADVERFALISTDHNPVHVDEAYARSTSFGGRIVHGMLVGSLISAVLGTQLPGPGSIYVSQELRFLVPVRPGDTITARVRVTAWDQTRGRITLLTEALNRDGVTVVTGEARLVMSAAVRSRK